MKKENRLLTELLPLFCGNERKMLRFSIKIMIKKMRSKLFSAYSLWKENKDVELDPYGI